MMKTDKKAAETLHCAGCGKVLGDGDVGFSKRGVFKMLLYCLTCTHIAIAKG
jgi:hypothetical protein